MAGAGMRLDGADAALVALGGIAARAREPRGMWEAIGMSLVVSTQRRFEEQHGPDGTPWPPSLRALATGGKTLIDRARLFRSISFEASDTGVAVGTNVIYGAIHQLGGEIIQPSFPRTIRMPARPYLGLDDDDEVEIVRIGEDHLAGEGAST